MGVRDCAVEVEAMESCFFGHEYVAVERGGWYVVKSTNQTGPARSGIRNGIVSLSPFL